MKIGRYAFTHILFAGIWIRDIRFKSNLVLTQVNKILKNLESKKLIKAVKSVAVSNIFQYDSVAFDWPQNSKTSSNTYLQTLFIAQN